MDIDIAIFYPDPVDKKKFYFPTLILILDVSKCFLTCVNTYVLELLYQPQYGI
jgi:hypothetical protein